MRPYVRYGGIALISPGKVTSITLIASYISSKRLRSSARVEDFANKLEKIHENQLPKCIEAFGSVKFLTGTEDTSVILLIKLLM